MTRAYRPSSTFPPEMMQLFMHVSNTGKSVTIATLGPRREDYISFRARMNEFRNAYRKETEASNDPARKTIVEAMYAVTLRNPEKVDGQWQITIETRERKLGAAIRDVLPPDADAGGFSPVATTEIEHGARAIHELFDDLPQNDNED